MSVYNYTSERDFLEAFPPWNYLNLRECIRLLKGPLHVHMFIPSTGVDREREGESGHRARAGRDILSLSLPVQALCPDSPPMSRSAPVDGRY